MSSEFVDGAAEIGNVIKMNTAAAQELPGMFDYEKVRVTFFRAATPAENEERPQKNGPDFFVYWQEEGYFVRVFTQEAARRVVFEREFGEMESFKWQPNEED